MSQTSIIAVMFLLSFAIFVTLRGDIPRWRAVFGI